MCTQVAYSPSSYILDSTRLVFPCLSSQTVSQSQSSKACQTSRLCSGGHAARLLSTLLSVCTSAWPPVLALTLERKDTCGLQMPAHTQGPLHFFCSVGKQRREKRSDWTTVLHWHTFEENSAGGDSEQHTHTHARASVVVVLFMLMKIVNGERGDDFKRCINRVKTAKWLMV